MSNLVHTLMAAVWGFALVAGAWTLGAKAWLSRRLDRLEHPADYDTPNVFLALVVPGLWPTAWLVSALLHLEETHAWMDACCSLLAPSGTTWQNWVFGLGAVVVVASQAYSLWRRWQSSHRRHVETANEGASRRVREVCHGHRHLGEFAERIRVVDCEAHVCATVGLIDQRIEIAESLVDQLDDAALEAALLHEAAHFSLRDPARQFILLISRILNPFSWVLSRETSAWRFAREIVCDRHAVEFGAEPVSVADAIVTAAKAATATTSRACARLCGHRPDVLSARVRLLLSGSEPDHVCRNPVVVPALGSAVLAGGLLLPHLIDAQLFSFHCVFEKVFHAATILI